VRNGEKLCSLLCYYYRYRGPNLEDTVEDGEDLEDAGDREDLEARVI
jgi:hypothetical protein